MGIQPQGESLRKAVQWVSEQRQDNPAKPVSTIAEAASLKYNLSPKDAGFLLRFVLEKDSEALD